MPRRADEVNSNSLRIVEKRTGAGAPRLGKLSSQVQHRFADKLYRGKVVQTLSWPVVDQIQDSIQLRVRNLCEISSSWKEETKQPVHILVAASLPGRMCIRKINLNFQGLFQFPEAKEFCSVV